MGQSSVRMNTLVIAAETDKKRERRKIRALFLQQSDYVQHSLMPRIPVEYILLIS